MNIAQSSPNVVLRGPSQDGGDNQPATPITSNRQTSPSRCRPAKGLAGLLWPTCRCGLVELAKLLDREQPLIDIPLLPEEPTDLASLESLGRTVQDRLAGWARYVSRTS